MRDNSDEPASPVAYGDGEQYFGLTKREHLAGLAMQALIAGNGLNGHEGYEMSAEEICATASVVFADALLAELDKSR
jgi:hypothetical protein